MNINGFLHWVIDQALEGNDIDGGELQDKAVECGLLNPVVATEACGKHCYCQILETKFGCVFPIDCYKKTEWSKE